MGEGGGEFTGVGVEEKTAAVGDGAAHTVSVLETVTELAKGVDVAEKGGAGAERSTGAEVFVGLGAAAAVELDDG